MSEFFKNYWFSGQLSDRHFQPHQKILTSYDTAAHSRHSIPPKTYTSLVSTLLKNFDQRTQKFLSQWLTSRHPTKNTHQTLTWVSNQDVFNLVWNTTEVLFHENLYSRVIFHVDSENRIRILFPCVPGFQILLLESRFQKTKIGIQILLETKIWPHFRNLREKEP